MSDVLAPDTIVEIVGAHHRADIDPLATALAALGQKSHSDLRVEWRRLYQTHPPKKLGRDLLELGVAWKLQERALGGVSATNKRQLDELARTMDTKSGLAQVRRKSLKPGARLRRSWGGETHEILVVEDGYIWQGQTWASLSAIAREMTGTRWSGPRFFGLDKPMTARAKAGQTSLGRVGSGE